MAADGIPIRWPVGAQSKPDELDNRTFQTSSSIAPVACIVAAPPRHHTRHVSAGRDHHRQVDLVYTSDHNAPGDPNVKRGNMGTWGPGSNGSFRENEKMKTAVGMVRNILFVCCA